MIDLVDKLLRMVDDKPLAALGYAALLVVAAATGIANVALRVMGFSRRIDEAHAKIQAATTDIGDITARVTALELHDATMTARIEGELSALRTSFDDLRTLIIGVVTRSGAEPRKAIDRE